MNERNLSVALHALFSSWMLSFLFEGQILYSLAASYGLANGVMVFGGIAVIFIALVLCGFFIKTKKAAKQLVVVSYPACILISVIFFFPPSVLWTLGILTSSFLAGGCVAAWGFYYQSGTPRDGRIKMAADVLILSNVLMILLNMAAIHISPQIGLALSMLMLLGAFALALRLPASGTGSPVLPVHRNQTGNITKPLIFLYLFISIITITSGLMYQVVSPAFARHVWLTSWFWAIPYIVALFIMRNLPPKINRAYLLYVAIAMLGLSFIGFMSLDYSAFSYLAVNTLMLGAFGVYDLFWWSILGEMLDFHNNPAKIFGIGLSANVFGVLIGGIIGHAFETSGNQSLQATLLALAVVCVSLAILPYLNKRLCALFGGHAYLAAPAETAAQNSGEARRDVRIGILSERESQVASLLFRGKTYKAIAGDLFISKNTVKYYVKNIYSKCNIQSRAELIDIILKDEQTAPK